MRTLPLLILLGASATLFAQGSPDSLPRLGKQSYSKGIEQDSVPERVQRIHQRLDSLPQTISNKADSSSVSRYLSRQQDSLISQVERWQVQKDSLFRPVDTLQQRLNTAQSRARTLSDSLMHRIPTRQMDRSALGSTIQEVLPTDATEQLAQLPTAPNVSIQKLIPQLPDLPATVHAVREHVGGWQQKLSSYPATLSKYKSKVSPYTASLLQGTQALEQQGQQLAVQHVPEGELLAQHQTALGDWQTQQTKQLDAQQQRAQLQQRIVTAAQDHFAGHSKKLTTAQQSLSKLKRKYSVVQGDTKQKRSSLQGTPLGKRLVYGGTMHIQKSPSLSMDLAPQLAYRWNKRISTGAGLVYRLALEGGIKKIRRQFTNNNAVYGGRVYGEYEVIRSLLLHGEYERLSQVQAAAGQDLTSRTWQTSLLAGIGKTYRIAGKWQGSVLLLYNFRHNRAANRQQSIHARPWIFRFGFQRSGS